MSLTHHPSMSLMHQLVLCMALSPNLVTNLQTKTFSSHVTTKLVFRAVLPFKLLNYITCCITSCKSCSAANKFDLPSPICYLGASAGFMYGSVVLSSAIPIRYVAISSAAGFSGIAQMSLVVPISPIHIGHVLCFNLLQKQK